MERKNRHLLDVTRTILIESSIHPRFWIEALTTAVHLINRLPSLTIAQLTPYFKLFGHHPSCDHLQTFRCVCFVHLPPTKRTKLTAQSAMCAFLGYATNQNGFVCYDPNARRIRISRNVFFENQCFFQIHLDCPPPSSSTLLPGFSVETIVTWFNPNFVHHRQEKATTANDHPLDPPPANGSTSTSTLRRSSRISRPPERYGFTHASLMTTLSSASIPSSYLQVVQNDCWNQAMK